MPNKIAARVWRLMFVSALRYRVNSRRNTPCVHRTVTIDARLKFYNPFLALPFSLAMVRYWIPTLTSFGIFRGFLRAGMNVAEFIPLQEYIIQPMHSDLAAWHALGCRLIDMRCFELEK